VVSAAARTAPKARTQVPPPRPRPPRSRFLGRRQRHPSPPRTPPPRIPPPRNGGTTGLGADTFSTDSHVTGRVRHWARGIRWRRHTRGAGVNAPGGDGKLRALRAALAVAAAASVFACRKTSEGRQLAAGLARDIVVAPGGGSVAFLQGAKHPADRGVPEDLLVGDLLLASTSGSDRAAFVGGGVPTLAPARAPAAVGGRAELFEVGTGRLREVANASSDFTFSDDGALYVLGPPGAKGGDRPLAVVDGFDAPPREIGRATSFAASGADVVMLSTERQPGEAFGVLLRPSRRPAAPEQLGERVSAFRLSSHGDVVFLARYDARARAATLMLARRGKTPREVAEKVQSFTLQKDRVLYVAQAPQKG